MDILIFYGDFERRVPSAQERRAATAWGLTHRPGAGEDISHSDASTFLSAEKGTKEAQAPFGLAPGLSASSCCGAYRTVR